MARCSSTKKSSVTGHVILVCDLSEGHEQVHPKHFDKLEMTTWNVVSNEPTPVPSTRLTPPAKPAKVAREIAKSVTKSVAAHTGRFDVLSV